MTTIANSSTATKKEIRALTVGAGLIVVQGATATTTYQAVIGGSTDNSTTIKSALAAAVADLPAVVEFGTGDFTITDGVFVLMTQGDRGLTIRGQGSGSTRIRMTGSGVFTESGYWHCLKISPSADPSAGDTDNYLKDINVEGISFYDDDPENHAAPIAETGAITASTNTLTLSGVNAAVANGTAIRIAGAGVAGAMLTTTVSSGGGTVNIVLADNASTTVSGAFIYSIESGVSEETHGVNVQYGYGVKITNCGFETIGDEGIELDYCEDAVITNNKFLDTPAAELSGGGAISAKNGCERVVISNNVIDGYGTGARNVYGINLKIILATAIKDILIAGNTITNHQSAGISINAASAVTSSRISIINNIISGCDNGILRAGGNPVEHTKIVSNTITDGITGINFNIGASNNLDCDVAFNTIDTMSDKGIECKGTRLNLSGNNIRNTDNSAILLTTDSIDVLISGGIISACAGGSGDNDRVITDLSAISSADVEGVTILDAQSVTSIIDGVRTVKDCYIESAAVNLGSRGIDDVQFVSDNTLINTGIRLVKNKSVCNGNHITIASNPSVAIIRVNAVNDSSVMNNYIEVTGGTRTAIEETTGANYNNISHNNVRNRGSGSAVTVVGAGTVNQDNII